MLSHENFQFSVCRMMIIMRNATEFLKDFSIRSYCNTKWKIEKKFCWVYLRKKGYECYVVNCILFKVNKIVNKMSVSK